MLLCIIVAAATEVTSNLAMCTLIMPIMAEMVSFGEASIQAHINENINHTDLHCNVHSLYTGSRGEYN